MAKKRKKTSKKHKMKIGKTKVINTPAGKRRIKKLSNGRVRIISKA